MNILTIDDNPADAVLLGRTLKKIEFMDFSLSHAADGADGLVELGRNEYDCVLVDYNLGCENGVEVIQRIRDSGYQHAIIVCTGEGSEAIAVRAMQAGADDYIVKSSITPATLFKSLESAAARATHNRHRIAQQDELASFAAVVAHDLGAPLRHITSFSDLLLEEATDLDAECRTYLEHIRTSGLRMQDMFAALLEYTRSGRNSAPQSAVALSDVLADVTADLQSGSLKQNVSIEVLELPTVWGDRVGLHQLFQNLISNALKYNQSERPWVQVKAIRAADLWRVSVIDNGIGIANDKFDEIFAPLKRLHGASEYAGIGLGLATVKKIVEQHDARIEVCSEPGAGSTFTVLFPDAATLASSEQ
ncbi:MAG: ATP-binding protein [Pseudomonadales bacterium]